MKSIFAFTILTFLLAGPLSAQIDPGNVLELISATTAEMNSLSAQQGMILFNTDDQLVYKFDGTAWQAIGQDDDWKIQGNDQYSAVAGNVGIGTNSPQGKLHISGGTSGDTKLIIEADTDDDNENDNPIIVFRQDGGLDESAIEHDHNFLRIRNSDAYGGITLETGTGTGYENAVEAMRITTDQKVGIGTASPSKKLDIQGDFAHSGSLYSRGPNYTYKWMRFADHVWGNSLVLGAGGNTILGGGEFATYAQPNFSTGDETLVLGSDYNIRFFTNTQNGWSDNINVMSLTNTGRVGIRTNSPSVELDVNGRARIRNLPASGSSQWLVADANGNVFVNASDRRLKKDITSIDNALQKIMQLDGKYFRWKKDGKKDIGFIAQDVEKVFPELVGETSDGYKSLNYPQMTAVLLNAIKELKEENNSLRKQIRTAQNQSFSLRINPQGKALAGNADNFVISKKAKGSFFVGFKNQTIDDYTVELSTDKRLRKNGSMIFINLERKSKKGFEVTILGKNADGKVFNVDETWTFSLRINNTPATSKSLTSALSK